MLRVSKQRFANGLCGAFECRCNLPRSQLDTYVKYLKCGRSFHKPGQTMPYLKEPILLVCATLSENLGKKTQRIEQLRDAMGTEAFAVMVDNQLWTRRNRSVPNGGQEWAQTLQWWHSEEGKKYWNGPPEPHYDLVRDVLLPSQRGLHRNWFSKPQASPVEKSLEVPTALVSHLALRVTDWLQERQVNMFPSLSCRCFVSGRVNFNREEGERVPSVHISCKEDCSDELILWLGSLVLTKFIIFISAYQHWPYIELSKIWKISEGWMQLRWTIYCPETSWYHAVFSTSTAEWLQQLPGRRRDSSFKALVAAGQENKTTQQLYAIDTIDVYRL